MGDQSSVPSVAPAKNPLDCIAHFAGEAAANTRAHLARLLHLPPLRHSPQTAGDNHTPRLLDRHDAHALAGTSGQKSAATQMDLHDSFSSAGGRSGFQGLPAGAQHSAGNSAVSGKAMGVTPQAALEHPGSAAVGGELAAREELGRATWTLLHTLAAQFPDRPSRQQQKDARSLVELMTRIYPCAECAAHFKDVVRSMPPEVSSGAALRQWMCRAHNVVNRSLDKPAFNCAYVEARWGALDCGAELACDLSLGQLRR